MRSTPPFVEVAPTRWSGSKTTVRSSPSEQGRKLPLVFLALVLVQRVGLELVLVDVAAAPHVERRDDRARAVDLDARGVRVGSRRVEKHREGHELLVHKAALQGGDDAAEVALLHPQLGGAAQLAKEERDDILDRLAPRRGALPLLRPGLGGGAGG